MDRKPATELAACSVRYLPADGADDQAEQWIDLIDLDGAVTIASVTPERAESLGWRLLYASWAARGRM